MILVLYHSEITVQLLHVKLSSKTLRPSKYYGTCNKTEQTVIAEETAYGNTQKAEMTPRIIF